MKKFLSLFALILIARMAIAQCSPAPSFSVSNAVTANNPLGVQLTSTTAPVSWPYVHWYHTTWGDGNSDYQPNPSHNYASPGTYTVNYYYYKYDSSVHTYCYDTLQQNITVAYSNCAASINVQPTSTPGQYNFSATNLSGTTTGICTPNNFV